MIKQLTNRHYPALAGYKGEHTPFDAVDDGFDYFSSAFLREEVGEILFVVHEEVFDEDGGTVGVAEEMFVLGPSTFYNW